MKVLGTSRRFISPNRSSQCWSELQFAIYKTFLSWSVAESMIWSWGGRFATILRWTSGSNYRIWTTQGSTTRHARCKTQATFSVDGTSISKSSTPLRNSRLLALLGYRFLCHLIQFWPQGWSLESPLLIKQRSWSLEALVAPQIESSHKVMP